MIPVRMYPNFERNSRWKGIIEYKSLIVIGIYMYILWTIESIFFENIFTKIYILIVLTTPLICLFYINQREESPTDIVFAVIKYMFSKKIYVYQFKEQKLEPVSKFTILFKKIKI